MMGTRDTITPESGDDSASTAYGRQPKGAAGSGSSTVGGAAADRAAGGCDLAGAPTPLQNCKPKPNVTRTSLPDKEKKIERAAHTIARTRTRMRKNAVGSLLAAPCMCVFVLVPTR